MHHFIGFDFVFFVLSQSKESSDVSVDQLFSGGGGFDFGQVLFEELNFDRLLHFGKGLVEELAEGVNWLVTRDVG